MGFGRPSKYTPEMIDKAMEYLENYEELGDPVPSVVGLACELGVAEKTLYEWIKKDDLPEIDNFRKCLELIASAQHRKLAAGGLTGVFSGPIAKLMMHKHGYHDKVDNELTGANGGPVQTITRKIVKATDGKGD